MSEVQKLKGHVIRVDDREVALTLNTKHGVPLWFLRRDFPEDIQIGDVVNVVMLSGVPHFSLKRRVDKSQ